MSTHIHGLKPGDTLSVKGTFSLLSVVVGPAVLSLFLLDVNGSRIITPIALNSIGPISKHPFKTNQFETVSLIAGGSGITPMIQIISGLLKDKADKTKIHLIFGNVTPEDIILKDELDAYAKAYPDRFKVTYVIDKAVEGWKGPTGYVNAELIKKHIPDVATGNTKVFVCGPPRKSFVALWFFVRFFVAFGPDQLSEFINHCVAYLINDSYDEVGLRCQGSQLYSG